MIRECHVGIIGFETRGGWRGVGSKRMDLKSLLSIHSSIFNNESSRFQFSSQHCWLYHYLSRSRTKCWVEGINELFLEEGDEEISSFCFRRKGFNTDNAMEKKVRLIFHKY